VPKFTHCPGASIANPRLWDCGGCEQCSPGHVCHLSGVADFCRGEGHGDEYPVTAWADYELIAMLHIRTALEDE
jgi:hypothetical protein